MTRFQRLAAVTVTATFVLIAIGGLVRATDSGLGCPDWPRCFGRWIPPGDLHAWIESTHRWAAGIVGILVVLVALAAWRTRQERFLRWASLVAVAGVVVQALIGAVVVWRELHADTVTLHLAAALAVVAMLELILIRSRHGAPPPGPRLPFATLTAVIAGLTYAQMLLGGSVTGYDAGLAFPDFPLMNGTLLPDLSRLTAKLQVAHRALAFLLAGLILVQWLRARRLRAASPLLPRFAGYALALILAQLALGAGNVWLRLSALTVVPHLAVGSLLWGVTFALALYARRYAVPSAAGGTGGGTAGVREPLAPAGAPRPTKAKARQAGLTEARQVGWRGVVGAYVALTKPRIIELLLITTVPAMFLAERGVPPVWLVAATLIGGTLQAASSNVINCYLDRDIDEVMRRTRRRPLPAHRVTPAAALRFGVALGVAGFAWLWLLVNPLAAALALAAELFYVFVYTLGLKRRSPQNIVIGGAAGAAPVLVGWAAVRGAVELPALVMFAIIFYWTPPHFWALSLRYAEDYRAAHVPMLPVVRGSRETSHQILYYTLLMVAVTLLLYPAAHMGLLYLAASLALGGVFVWRAAQLWRDASGQRAVRLFAFSNHYLALLFLAVALDALIAG